MKFRQLDEELITQICNIMRMGTPYDVACVSLECSPEEALEWVQKGYAAKDGICHELYHRAMRAQAQCQVMHIQKLLAEGGAQSSRWILEKTNPDHWGVEAKKKKGQKVLTDGK